MPRPSVFDNLFDHCRCEYRDCAALGECCDRTGGSLHYLTGDMHQRDNAHRLREGNNDNDTEMG